MAAFVVAPILIQWIHAGGGPDRLQTLMPGRGTVAVSAYLADWRALALPLSFLLATTLLLLWFAAPLARLLRERPASGQDPPAPFSWREALRLAAWCGLAFGLAEAYYLAWKLLVLSEVVPGFRPVSVHSLWMAPLVDLLVFLGLGTLVVLPLRHAGAAVASRWLVAVLGTIAVVGLILMTDRLAPWAALLLGAGLAWQLGRLAGRHPARLRAMARRHLPWMATAVPALLLLATGVPWLRERAAIGALPPAPDGDMPNVLLVVLDTQRAQNLQLYGYARPTSPVLAGVGAEGVVFDRAISPTSWTLPSHGSMFTGQLPNELSTSFVSPLDGTFPTLAEQLRDRGYATAGFVANLVFGTPLFGLDRGFVHYEAQPVSLGMTLESAWIIRYPLRQLQLKNGRLAVKDAARITGDFLAWHGEQAPERPWFGFLNYFDAHGPYRSPPAWRARFMEPGRPVPRIRGGGGAIAYQAWERDALRDAYDGAIAWIDFQLGVLFDSLRARGDLDRTLVIVTSDHGEAFGAHGQMGHGQGQHIQVMHVPLLVRYPALAGAGRVRQPVTLADLPASVMAALGIADHPFPGRPWWELLEDGGGRGVPVFAEYQERRSVLVDGWHFIRDGGEELYDLTVDPVEGTNLVARVDPAVVARLRSLLERGPAAR